MKVITRVKDGNATVEIVDPSDGTVVRYAPVGEGEQVCVVATTATSASDLEVYGPEAIPEPEAEAAESGEGGESEAAANLGEPPPAGEGEGLGGANTGTTGPDEDEKETA